MKTLRERYYEAFDKGFRINITGTGLARYYKGYVYRHGPVGTFTKCKLEDVANRLEDYMGENKLTPNQVRKLSR